MHPPLSSSSAAAVAAALAAAALAASATMLDGLQHDDKAVVDDDNAQWLRQYKLDMAEYQQQIDQEKQQQRKQQQPLSQQQEQLRTSRSPSPTARTITNYNNSSSSSSSSSMYSTVVDGEDRPPRHGRSPSSVSSSSVSSSLLSTKRVVDTSTKHVLALTGHQWMGVLHTTTGGTHTRTGPRPYARTRPNKDQWTPAECARDVRDRNREHARTTRLRKKVYLAELKATVTALVEERDAVVAAQTQLEVKNRNLYVVLLFVR